MSCKCFDGCNRCDERIKCISGWLNDYSRNCIRMIPENRYLPADSCHGGRIVYTSSCR